MLALQMGLSFPAVSGAAGPDVSHPVQDAVRTDSGGDVPKEPDAAEESSVPQDAASSVSPEEANPLFPDAEAGGPSGTEEIPEESGEMTAAESEAAPAGETSPEPDSQTAYGGENDETVILVSSYGELRTALSEKNNYSTLYLTANIIADAAGISIHPEKTAVVIDGSPPDGGRFSLTQYPVTNAASLIKVDSGSAATASVTLRNMDIAGKNAYGVVWVMDSKGAAVTLSFENVNYSGPQPFYHRYGMVRILGGGYTVTGGELAEAMHAEIGGDVTLENTSSNSLLWLYGTSSTLRFLENANVSIPNAYYLVYGSIADVTLEAGAQVSLTGRRFGFSHGGDTVGTFTMKENSGLTILLNTAESYAALRVSKAFSMSPGSSAVIVRTGTAGIPLRLAAAGATVTFDRPRRVFFYSSAGVPLRFTGAGTLNITTSALNLWTTAVWPLPAGMETLPTRIWNKSGEGLLTVTGKYNEAANQSLSHNLTADDPVTTSLTAQSFNLEKSQLFAIGELSLLLRTPDGGAALSGTAPPGAQLSGQFTLADGQEGTVYGTAGDGGAFSLELPGALQADSTAAVLARSHDLLMRQTVAVPDPEKHRLAFLFVPESTSFGVLPVPGSSGLVPRTDAEFGMTVADTRLNSLGWRIDASLSRPLTAAVNGKSVVLPGSVLFADADGTVQKLSEVPLTVYRESSGAQGEFQLHWNAAEGLLLELLPGDIYSGAAYSTTIQWTLVDAP